MTGSPVSGGEEITYVSTYSWIRHVLQNSLLLSPAVRVRGYNQICGIELRLTLYVYLCLCHLASGLLMFSG